MKSDSDNAISDISDSSERSKEQFITQPDQMRTSSTSGNTASHIPFTLESLKWVVATPMKKRKTYNESVESPPSKAPKKVVSLPGWEKRCAEWIRKNSTKYLFSGQFIVDYSQVAGY